MNSPLREIEALNDLIRQLQKIDSKFHAGHFLALYRENRRIIAQLETQKSQFIELNKNALSEDMKDVDDISSLIHDLSKIDSRLHAGQFIDAHANNEELIEHLKSRKLEIITNQKASEEKSE